MAKKQKKTRGQLFDIKMARGVKKIKSKRTKTNRAGKHTPKYWG